MPRPLPRDLLRPLQDPLRLRGRRQRRVPGTALFTAVVRVVTILGVNSIDIKNLGPVFGPFLGPILPVSSCLPRPANLPIFNLTFRARFRAIIYVN